MAAALAEDVGRGDRTTEWCVEAGARGRAEIVAKSTGVIFGHAVAAEVFRCAGGAELEPLVAEGSAVGRGTRIAGVAGPARTILTGERTALNFLGRLSGIASLTRRFVAAVEGTGARITDTRKTTPLWRELERAATAAGGAVNHRSGLDAMVLIKENHIASAGGIAAAVARVHGANREGLRVEVEVTDLDEVREALAAGVDRIMLDNMDLATVREAVRLIEDHDPRPEIEASGGVDLDTVGDLARAGVGFISVGALTHSAPALDLSLRMTEVES
ncbi:MAG: carboxylating nicotinate-nucleotide diphosphorylase [Gemmatimonadetes bacterium]|uniref:Probable nicotinate-nucleotide pyrophosphorylase [carboxylating] n=1 Tax=Candidatus Kutchimonas denitrificans TaxID=3056748 RepID=A0AAE4Z8Z8_9BACT|nr:carboxylating nicotinate-nucleotide diphosphorylase [Gemmatimonadota bacterium]NIR76029.1 carboxylating nicotinate-nucleotide diphosphorylase [Candidatus Kutchimonas denitrificans]NIS02221.1 carboxylating nicotinate-nucleotide diphosphorylase [Gemmatimonadota bacterium]NIT68047.1 carboxylating nicotinate-nucleotide diphosphorylase [Gemmatimonadota bacterium]NIU54073.1 carboxylating nicotinate-nucleotide diphosphorylase [Gemmatimonadota bacterium]